MNKEMLQTTKKCLILVDMIKGFIVKGNLADPSISRIIKECVRLVEEFITNGDLVIAFYDDHISGSTELNYFLEHCVNEEEKELIEELKVFESKLIKIGKNSTSGMFASNFLEYFEVMRYLTEVIIVGCCTDICVMNLAIPLKNYFNQFNRDIDVIVPMNAVDTYHIPNVHDKDEWNHMAFRFMEQAGISLVKKYGGNYEK